MVCFYTDSYVFPSHFEAIGELQVQLKDQENKIFGLPKTLDEDSYQVEQTNEELNLVMDFSSASWLCSYLQILMWF